MLLNSIYGNYGNYGFGGGCSTCGGSTYASPSGCSTCGSSIPVYGGGLGNAAYSFVGEWVNIVVTLTILQSILGLVCNWNCGGNCNC